MRITIGKQWKPKQHKAYHKRIPKKPGKFRRQRDRRRKLIGKYVILLTKRTAKYGAILKFITKRRCRVEQAVLVDPTLTKQTSSKFIITPKRNKSLLKKIEVTFTKKNVEDYEAIVSLSKVMMELEKENEQSKKVTPIKILSCATCNHKFTRRKHYEEHVAGHNKARAAAEPQSSDSEKEMVIDDDCILVLEGDDLNYSTNSHAAPLTMKEDPDDAKPDEFYCMVEDCGRKFNSEELLLMHIATSHDRHEDRPFKCTKCGDGFKRESGLVAHIRIKHAVEEVTIDSPDDEQPRRPRRKSVFIANQPKVNGLNSKPGSSTSSKPQNSQPLISFELFDSCKKSSFMCHVCSNVFPKREYLDRHVVTQHIVKGYICYKCNVGYQRANLIPHMKTAHINSINESDFIKCLSDIESTAIFRCCFCRFSVKSRSRVSEHMKDEHYEEFEKHETIYENSSSPDSLENLVLPETAKLIESELDLLVEIPTEKKETGQPRKRKRHNDPSFKYRCGHCLRRYAKLFALKKHICSGANAILIDSDRDSRFQTTSQQSTQRTFNSSGSLVNSGSPPTSTAEETIASKNKTRTLATTSIISQMREKSKSKKPSGFFGCQMCPAVFTDKDMFNEHSLTAHSTNKSKSLASNGF